MNKPLKLLEENERLINKVRSLIIETDDEFANTGDVSLLTLKSKITDLLDRRILERSKINSLIFKMNMPI